MVTTTITTTAPKIVTTTTQTTVAQTIGQTRSGMTTTVVPRVDVALVADRLVSSVVIPYMRPRNISFVSKGLKSNTVMHATFDTQVVDAYIIPATKMTLNNYLTYSNIYDTDSNAGSNFEHVARQIGSKLDLALNKGMILKGQTSGATCVVLYQQPVAAGATSTNVYVVNVKGVFQNAEIVIGSLDGGTTGPRGTLAGALTVATIGQPLVTDFAGVCSGIFALPNSNAKRFSTGQRVLQFQDSTVNTPTTMATATYSATGILDTYQASYTATRNASVVQTAVNQSQILTNKLTSVSSSTSTTPGSRRVSYADPLAQSFVVDMPGGMFITKVDLFFITKETVQSTPVHIEIREVVNGYPANIVLPFSVVYKDPVNVNVNALGAIATTFTFPSPVYLSDGKEYAIVILSDSNKYNLFISQMGEADIATGKVISTQPTLGVLFKSSNGSTWTANQMQDLKFTLYRALFDTVNTGYVNFINGPTHPAYLDTNPFHTTLGSKVIRVFHPNHQMPNGSKVEIVGATGPSNLVGGIPIAEINGQRVISNVDPDSYTITVATTNATATISAGGDNVTATENVQFDTICVNTSELVFQNTTVDYQIKTTSGQSVDGVETPYVKDASYALFHQNQNNHYGTPRMVASRLNEVTSMASARSMEVLATMKTERNNVSPVIDTQRLSVTLVNNKLNWPSHLNTDVAVIDDRSIAAASTVIGFAAADNAVYTATSNTVVAAALATLTAGKYIDVTGSTTALNDGMLLVTGTEVLSGNQLVYIATTSKTLTTQAAGPAITIVQKQKFVDEICPMFGTIDNKYVSREIILAQPCTYLKIKVAAQVPALADVWFYYKTNPTGSSTALSDRNWIKANPVKPIARVHGDVYNDIDIDVENIPAFDTVQIKIVLVSTSTAQVPLCKELRIIACA